MIKLNSPFLPMEPKIYEKAFDDPDFGFQVKWDGIRITAHINSGDVLLFNRKKRNKTAQYPEITYALSALFPKNNLILDGEMISLFDGKPRFDYIIRRDFSKNPNTIKHLMQKIPAQYIIFDIIYLDNNSLIDIPFWKRDEILKDTIRAQYPITTTDTFKTRGTTLFDIVKQKGLEGIVAKKLDSPYVLGGKNSYWLKIKNWRKLCTFIGGFIAQNNKVRSLLLGIFQNKDFIYIGKVASGLTEDLATLLYYQLCKSQISVSPFYSPSIQNIKEKVCWVKPNIEVEVKYIDFTDKGQLRHPKIIDIH